MRRDLFLVYLLFLAGCSTVPSKADPALLAGQIDKLLQTAVDQKKVPGAVAMVATRDGVVFEGAAALNKDAIFAIASMTKAVTSVAIMQLVEAGHVKVDEPASTYVPELAQIKVLADGQLRPPRNPITVRHLLTHTSGFSYEFMSPEIFGLVKQGKVASLLAGGDAFLQAPLLFDPGQRWEYGINTDWLGRLVERVSGQKLDAYFRAHILEPLAMNDTYFQVPQEKSTRLAKLYQRKEDGSLVEQPMPPVASGAFLSGGGGLFSTAADYIRFTQAIMNGGQLSGKSILKPETAALMQRNQIGALTIHPVRSVIPQLAKDKAVLPGALDKFGFGFALNSHPVENGRAANTMAWAGIFNTFFWIDREKQVCAVLMTQMSPFLDDGAENLLRDVDRAVYFWLR